MTEIPPGDPLPEYPTPALPELQRSSPEEDSPVTGKQQPEPEAFSPAGLVETVFQSLFFTFALTGALLGYRLSREGKRKKGFLLGAMSVTVFIAYLVLQAFLPITWQAALIIYATLSLFAGVLIYLAFRRFGGVSISPDIFTSPGNMIINAAIGGIFAYLIGISRAFFMFLHYNLQDVASYKASILTSFLIKGAVAIPAGIIIGALLARRFGKVRITELGLYLLAFCSLSIILLFFQLGARALDSHFGAQYDDLFVSSSDQMFLDLLLYWMRLIAIFYVSWKFLALVKIRTFCFRLLPAAGLLFLFTVGIHTAMGSQENLFRYLGERYMAHPKIEMRKLGASLTALAAKRYPFYPGTGLRVLKAGRIYLEEGQKAKAEALLKWVADTYVKVPGHKYARRIAQASLKSIGEWNPEDSPVRLTDMAPPAVETYTDPCWMALLAAITKWEKNEDSLKLRLREQSSSRDQIVLPDLTRIVDVRLAASRLGYRTALRSTDTPGLIALLRGGFPVLTILEEFGRDQEQSYAYLGLIWAHDPVTDSFAVLNYSLLGSAIDQTFRERQNVASHILSGKKEEGLAPEGEKRLRWATVWIPRVIMEEQKSEDSFIATIVYPQEKERELCLALKVSPCDLACTTLLYTEYDIGSERIDSEDWVDALNFLLSAGKHGEAPPDLAHSVAIAARELERKSWDLTSPERMRAFEEEAASLKSSQANKNVLASSEKMLERDLEKGSVSFFMLDTLYQLALSPASSSPQRQIMLCARILDRIPDDTKHRAELAHYLMTEDRFREAAGHYQILTECEPANTLYQINYALCLAFTGDPENAFRRLEMIDPYKRSGFQAETHMILAERARAKGKYQAAIKEYREVLSRRNPYPLAHLGLADSLIAAGKKEEAERELQWLRDVGLGKYREEAVKRLSGQGGERNTFRDSAKRGQESL